MTYKFNEAVSAKALADLREAVGWNRMENEYDNPLLTSYYHTNGAGDTFFGAFLSRLSARRNMLDLLSENELRRMLRFANCAAAITTSRPGAIPAMPSVNEVLQML